VGAQDRNLARHTPHRAGSPGHDPELEMRGADARGPDGGLPRVLHATCARRTGHRYTAPQDSESITPVDAWDERLHDTVDHGNRESTGMGIREDARCTFNP
jgi:hypothetical protein